MHPMESTSVSIILITIVAVLLATVNCSCPCGDSPDPNDDTSGIMCSKMDSIFNGIDGKSVGQCHNVVIRNNRIPPCKLNDFYDSVNDQSLLHSVGDGYVFYRIYQPGYYFNQFYSNKLFCAYNVQCAPNQFLYFHFSTHDIENPQSTGQCLDAITLTRDSIPNDEITTCGRVGIDGTYSDFGISQDGYEAQRLKVHFRSNRACRAGGYFLWVACVNDTQEVPSCIPPQKKSIKETTYEVIDKYISVPLNGILEYNGTTVIMKVKESIQYSSTGNISSLTVKSTETSKKVTYFYNSTKTKTFYGQGKLYVTCLGIINNCTAVYLIQGVPLSYRMNAKERKIVDTLLSYLVPYYRNDNRYYILNSSLSYENSSLDHLEETPAKQVLTERHGRDRKSKLPQPLPPSLVSSYYRKQTILMKNLQLAIRNYYSCNAIVKSVCKYFLKVIREKEIKRKEKFRKT